MKVKLVKAWVEAMRLRTLPVSVAGVVAGCGLALIYGHWLWTPALLCLGVAVLAQIASNFANEYFDYKAGIDAPGREGPRRGVTEGDITPRAMLSATLLTLALACLTGCGLIYYGGWQMIPVGLAIALGVIAYSAGPYPLSHHGLGELAVILFFGLVPVSFTFYLIAGYFTMPVIAAAAAVGFMTANVLIVNNYRDYDDDRRVGKRTLGVILGRQTYRYLYLVNAVIASSLFLFLKGVVPAVFSSILIGYLLISSWICAQMGQRQGRALTPLLGMTAVAILACAAVFTLCCSIIYSKY